LNSQTYTVNDVFVVITVKSIQLNGLRLNGLRLFNVTSKSDDVTYRKILINCLKHWNVKIDVITIWRHNSIWRLPNSHLQIESSLRPLLQSQQKR